jgi:hypothetical protein
MEKNYLKKYIYKKKLTYLDSEYLEFVFSIWMILAGKTNIGQI